jgi:hypothetical protein
VCSGSYSSFLHNDSALTGCPSLHMSCVCAVTPSTPVAFIFLQLLYQNVTVTVNVTVPPVCMLLHLHTCNRDILSSYIPVRKLFLYYYNHHIPLFTILDSSFTFHHCRILSLIIKRNMICCHDFHAKLTKLLCGLDAEGCCRILHNSQLSLSSLVILHSRGYNVQRSIALPLSLAIHLILKPLQSFSVLSVIHASFVPFYMYFQNSYVGTKHGGLVSWSTALMKHGSPVGGGHSHMFAAADVFPYSCNTEHCYNADSVFKFVDYIQISSMSSYSIKDGYIAAKIPLLNLVPNIPISMVLKVACFHNIPVGSHVPKKNLPKHFADHSCNNCSMFCSIFVQKGWQKQENKTYIISESKTQQPAFSLPQNNSYIISESKTQQPTFPSPPLSTGLAYQVITDFCKDSAPSILEEAGCVVCGLLTPVSKLTRLKSVKGMLKVLDVQGITRVERKSVSDPIRGYKGPVLDYSCNKICDRCRSSIQRGNLPDFALARGIWIGNIPKELSELRFIEKLLVARLCHNCCFICVASGMRKMTSHVVAFQAPIPKLYNALPPPIEDLDEVLAILFTGPAKPTQKDFQRTPLLVRRNAVARALEWLKLNHADYADIQISYKNLEEYPEDDPPVSIEYRQSVTNKYPENTSSFDDEIEDGTEEGDCPFVVHGLTGESLDTMTSNKLKGIALTYLNKGGKMLAVGHSSKFESIYNNPQYYPQMFPWLFPYGMGGIGSTHLSEVAHK